MPWPSPLPSVDPPAQCAVQIAFRSVRGRMCVLIRGRGPGGERAMSRGPGGERAASRRPDGERAVSRGPDGERATSRGPDGEGATSRGPGGERAASRRPDGERAASRRPDGERAVSRGRCHASARRPFSMLISDHCNLLTVAQKDGEIFSQLVSIPLRFHGLPPTCSSKLPNTRCLICLDAYNT